MEPILFSLNSICTAFDLERRQDVVAPMFFIDGKLKEWRRWGARWGPWHPRRHAGPCGDE